MHVCTQWGWEDCPSLPQDLGVCVLWTLRGTDIWEDLMVRGEPTGHGEPAKSYTDVEKPAFVGSEPHQAGGVTVAPAPHSIATELPENFASTS